MENTVEDSSNRHRRSDTELGTDVAIGAYSVIGPNCMIGDGTVIGPHVVLEEFTQIGRECRCARARSSVACRRI